MRRYSLKKRAAYSVVIVFFVLLFGTLGMHFIEGMPYVDAFYFTSLIATGEGPSTTPSTMAGKLFASFLSFISIGAVVASLIFLLGPFAGRMIKHGIEFTEEEIRKVEGKVQSKENQASRKESKSDSE
jgi:hypothetical protein